MNYGIEAFQNRYLSDGQDRVDAILGVTADPSLATTTTARGLLLGFIVDTSGSMQGERIAAVKRAVSRAIGLLDESVSFFVVTFQEQAQVRCAPQRATQDNKDTARDRLDLLRAGGGTAMSTGLAEARSLFVRAPDAIHQAVFLTDGKNESERPAAVGAELQRCEGLFECDCWGVGTDWQVGEVQEIARALLGKASLIPDAAGIDGAFGAAVAKAQAKAIKDARLRIWTPMGAEVIFVKQVNPTIEDLTKRATSISPQVREYPTGAWGGGEARDFHVVIKVPTGQMGDEMLAARPSIVYQVAGPNGWVEQEDKPAEGRVFASWTGDETLSSRLDEHVAHYTGQDELASAIQEGLELRARGDEAAATRMLGRAVQLAHESDNAEMTARLARVVDVVEAASGTVRLRRDVAKAAEMDLQLESTTTRRARKTAPGETAPGAAGGVGA
jgi:hypothetical protein